MTTTDLPLATRYVRDVAGACSWASHERHARQRRKLTRCATAITTPINGKIHVTRRSVALAGAGPRESHATNSRAASVERTLDKFGLRRFFKDLLTRERYAKAKPEPDAFLAAAAALGLPPARCVVLEDAERGVVAARRAGTKCVAVPNEWTKVLDFSQADRVVASLDEVTCELIDELVGA